MLAPCAEPETVRCVEGAADPALGVDTAKGEEEEVDIPGNAIAEGKEADEVDDEDDEEEAVEEEDDEDMSLGSEELIDIRDVGVVRAV